jgi:hypothetical protein
MSSLFLSGKMMIPFPTHHAITRKATNTTRKRNTIVLVRGRVNGIHFVGVGNLVFSLDKLHQTLIRYQALPVQGVHLIQCQSLQVQQFYLILGS